VTAANPHALLRPAIVFPLATVALVWGSTWYVITGQIGDVPPSWSVTWRFMMATPFMFAVALAMRTPLRMGRAGHMLALFMGLTQFFANFNFIYSAEEHLTSGIVAVMYGLLMVPNTLLARIMLGHKVTRRFMAGSAVAIAGIALLLVHEAQTSPVGGNVPLGIALAIGGILSASLANVVQAGTTGRSLPLMSMLAWAMLYGTGFDAAFAWTFSGPPVVPQSGAYWAGVAWLALAGSVLTFPLYYSVVRTIGPGRAAYNAVLVIVVAMMISTGLERYVWSPLAIGGAALALIGLILALRARSV